jgi:hypothetical protein
MGSCEDTATRVRYRPDNYTHRNGCVTVAVLHSNRPLRAGTIVSNVPQVILNVLVFLDVSENPALRNTIK